MMPTRPDVSAKKKRPRGSMIPPIYEDTQPTPRRERGEEEEEEGMKQRK